MLSVQPSPLPPASLLLRYKTAHGFADCYMIEVPGTITQEQFVEAFYTSPLFKIERTILKYAVSKPSTDDDARALASGKVKQFSAWIVEEQTPAQLLLADIAGRTRSWLMAVSTDDGINLPSTTKLYFGSAVVPRINKATSTPRMGWVFYTLLGFHRLYSRLLLSTASRRVNEKCSQKKHTGT